MATEEKLDRIYDLVDESFLKGDFVGVDDMLRRLCAAQDQDIVLGWLTATLPAKGKLPHRATLLAKFRAKLESDGADADALLAGLE